MRTANTVGKRRGEAGIALLIAIFVLLLIAVVAIALVVSSGTESALTGNYRSSTSVFYAAVGGLEEVRSRLRSSDPNSFQKINPPGSFLPAPGTLAVCVPAYVLNPAPGQVVTPWDPANPYFDAQFGQEFGTACPAPLPPGPSPSTPSVWTSPASGLNGLPFPAPAYKWVRVNSVSEKSMNLDVDADGLADSTTPLYYDNVAHRLSNTGGASSEVLELTALAVLPNGSQKLMQYLVAGQPLNLNFPAALTLAGPSPQFGASPSPSYWVKGGDQGTVGNCTPTGTSVALGYTDTSYSPANFERPTNSQGILSGPSPTPDLRGNYTNGVASGNIVPVMLPPNLATVGALNTLVQTIEQNADVVVNGNATQSSGSGPLTSAMSGPNPMSATNPMTIIINGDFTLNGWRNTGYGLLLVTGNFTYDPDTSWDGIILVIGNGSMTSHQGSFANTSIQGAVLVANTLGLPASSPPGSSTFNFFSTPGNLANGIYYSSCWIQAATPSIGYKTLSFHEISQ